MALVVVLNEMWLLAFFVRFFFSLSVRLLIWISPALDHCSFVAFSLPLKVPGESFSRNASGLWNARGDWQLLRAAKSGDFLCDFQCDFWNTGKLERCGWRIFGRNGTAVVMFLSLNFSLYFSLLLTSVGPSVAPADPTRVFRVDGNATRAWPRDI